MGQWFLFQIVLLLTIFLLLLFFCLDAKEAKNQGKRKRSAALPDPRTGTPIG